MTIDLIGNDYLEVSCTSSSSSLQDTVRDKSPPILKPSKDSSRKKKYSVFTKEIEKFDLTIHETFDNLKKKGKDNNLVITSTSRNPSVNVDRIGFGLSQW